MNILGFYQDHIKEKQMVDKSKLVIATSQIQNPIPFLIELLFNLLSQMITISTIKLTSQPVR